VALLDGYPVSPGHTLVVPVRHVSDFFELTTAEVASVAELVSAMKERLDRGYAPDGYNVGVNVGTAAGQTVFHVHIHLIPRYAHDVPDPVGGVRNVIPGCGRYRDGTCLPNSTVVDPSPSTTEATSSQAPKARPA
jgi:diadenosine tetraphosphate (Ap4A) HIT family hydrolase